MNVSSEITNPTRIALWFALERHFWRTTRSRGWRAVGERLEHVDRYHMPAYFLWWCYGAMMVEFQMASADIPEGDERAAQSAVSMAWRALACRLRLDPDLLGSRVMGMVGPSYPRDLAEALLWQRGVGQAMSAADGFLLEILRTPSQAPAQIKRLIGLGKRLRNGG